VCGDVIALLESSIDCQPRPIFAGQAWLSYFHCFSSRVHMPPGSDPSLMKASTTFLSNFDVVFSKFYAGRAWPKAIDPVLNTAPLFGAVK
jgi:hypothetical protein